MTLHEEILAAEARMSVTLTNSQRIRVAACVEGHAEAVTTYVKRVTASVLAAR